MKIYLAGPMRGYAEFNFPAFDDAAARGRKLGIEILSPADMDRAAGFDAKGMKGLDEEWQSAMKLGDVLRRDVEAVLEADGIALLPGWEKSTGARAEKALAEWAGKQIFDAATFNLYDETPCSICAHRKSMHFGDICYGAEPNCPCVEFQLAPKHKVTVLSGCVPAEALVPFQTPPPVNAQSTVSVSTVEGNGGEIQNGKFKVKDSGSRRVFSTGAQRDAAEGKGWFHLLPYKPLERLAQLYEAGARKYQKNNWRRGIPLSVFLDSAARHLGKLIDAWDDEDHAAAVLWNLCGYIQTEEDVKQGRLPKDLLDDNMHNPIPKKAE